MKECKFTNSDEHIIDDLIFGSNHKRVQSYKLLEHDDSLNLDKAIDIARTQEATNKIPGQAQACGNCGRHYDLSQRSSCPAYGTKCKACGKDNHWNQV